MYSFSNPVQWNGLIYIIFIYYLDICRYVHIGEKFGYSWFRSSKRIVSYIQIIHSFFGEFYVTGNTLYSRCYMCEAKLTDWQGIYEK